MTLRGHWDAILPFTVDHLFAGESYRLLLTGEYQIEQDGDENVLVLERNDEGTLDYTLKFQRPTFDNSGEVFPVIRCLDEATQQWTFAKDEELPKEDRMITPDAWNKAGRENELEKLILFIHLEENAGSDIKIWLVPSVEDMPFKGKKDHSTQYVSCETITLAIVNDGERKIVHRIRIPN